MGQGRAGQTFPTQAWAQSLGMGAPGASELGLQQPSAYRERGHISDPVN